MFMYRIFCRSFICYDVCCFSLNGEGSQESHSNINYGEENYKTFPITTKTEAIVVQPENNHSELQANENMNINAFDHNSMNIMTCRINLDHCHTLLPRIYPGGLDDSQSLERVLLMVNGLHKLGWCIIKSLLSIIVGHIEASEAEFDTLLFLMSDGVHLLPANYVLCVDIARQFAESRVGIKYT
ncbi:unnamed protein product [Vicia faba]|uniref:Uncharacterized protein n=1 Tax=Vicia faba TaxID=3906 RepID=A0AAV1A6N0_VICFA|nr:unnamed protein product [Vicia faba]